MQATSVRSFYSKRLTIDPIYPFIFIVIVRSMYHCLFANTSTSKVL